MQRRCPRVWQVEAARDGRLKGEELDSLNEHLPRCADCQAEQRWLAELGQELAEPGLPSDALSLRRLRFKTLAEADAALRARGAARPGWRLVAGCALLLAAGGALWLTRGGSQAGSGIAVDVVGPGASYRRSHDESGEYIELTDGVLQLDARHKGPREKLVVRVPDGAIEDLGTVFKVTVAGQRTREIAVSEGVVVFRRPGSADLRLTAGSVWNAQSAGAQSAAIAPVATGTASADVEPPAPSASLAAAPATRDVSPARSAAHRAAAECVDEDASYLRVIALLREHRSEEARMAAADYLRRCPSGFRRAEIERISQRP